MTHPQPKIQNLKTQPQPPLPGTPYEIPDFLDLLHASGWRIVPGSLRWEGPKGEEKPVVDIEEVDGRQQTVDGEGGNDGKV